MRRVILAEVVMLFHGFGDTPGALKAIRENYKVTGAEGYRICAVSNRYPAFKHKAGFLFSVSPIEGAGFALPDRPGPAVCSFGVRGFFDDDIFYSRHFVLLAIPFPS